MHGLTVNNLPRSGESSIPRTTCSGADAVKQNDGRVRRKSDQAVSKA